MRNDTERRKNWPCKKMLHRLTFINAMISLMKINGRADRSIIKSSNLQSPLPRLLRQGSPHPWGFPPWRRWRRRRRGWGWRLPGWAPTCWWRRDRDKTGPWSALRRRGVERNRELGPEWLYAFRDRPAAGRACSPSHRHLDSRRGAGARRQKFNRFFLRSGVSSPLFNLAALIFLTSSVTRKCDWYVCILNKVLFVENWHAKHFPYHTPDLSVQRPEFSHIIS